LSYGEGISYLGAKHGAKDFQAIVYSLAEGVLEQTNQRNIWV
jgi:hypothetical protein